MSNYPRTVCSQRADDFLGQVHEVIESLPEKQPAWRSPMAKTKGLQAKLAVPRGIFRTIKRGSRDQYIIPAT